MEISPEKNLDPKNELPPEFIELVENGKEPVNYQKIWGKEISVIFFGERHNRASDKEEVANHIEDLKNCGATHLALEMLKQEDQKIIDSYINCNMDREKILELLRDWQQLPDNPERYMALIDIAKDNCLQIIALDPKVKQVKKGDADFEKEMMKKNEAWVEILQKLTESPNNKIVVYGGGSHTGYSNEDTVNRLLTKKQIKSIVVRLAGATPPEEGATYFSNRIAQAANRLNLNNERFALKLKGEKRTADYIIHLPQLEQF